MNTIAPLLKLKHQYRKWLIILALAFVCGIVFMNLKLFAHPLLYNPYAVTTLKYLMILGTGIVIWYGYKHYYTILEQYKNADNQDTKRIQYIKANRLQNNLVFLALAINILAIYITFEQMFIYLSTICIVINLIYMPSEDKFISDFIEQIDEDRYETEINKQDSNNINQNFES